MTDYIINTRIHKSYIKLYIFAGIEHTPEYDKLMILKVVLITCFRTHIKYKINIILCICYSFVDQNKCIYNNVHIPKLTHTHTKHYHMYNIF